MFTRLAENTETVISYEISGGTPMLNRSQTEKFVPELLEIRFVNGRFSSAAVSGGMLRHDGTAGTKWLKNKYFSIDELPDWVAILVRATTPKLQRIRAIACDRELVAALEYPNVFNVSDGEALKAASTALRQIRRVLDDRD